MSKPYRTCENCGANLDADETCDCMNKFEIRELVCDYAIYERGQLRLILNSRRIAEQIVSLLEEDERSARL